MVNVCILKMLIEIRQQKFENLSTFSFHHFVKNVRISTTLQFLECQQYYKICFINEIYLSCKKLLIESYQYQFIKKTIYVDDLRKVFGKQIINPNHTKEKKKKFNEIKKDAPACCLRCSASNTGECITMLRERAKLSK